jgi:hypothetical protein
MRLPADSARARADLDVFISRFVPEIGALARSCIARMRARLPGAIEFVYDNYNALVIGYGPTERPSEALFSLVVYPARVSLCFIQGAKLAKAGGDPDGLLQGGGNQVRHIRLPTAAVLGARGVRALITRSVAQSPKKFDKRVPLRTVVKAVSAKQRPRRPAATGARAPRRPSTRSGPS